MDNSAKINNQSGLVHYVLSIVTMIRFLNLTNSLFDCTTIN